jgi:glycosyltransferase involved in cell wall biosynthesis
MQPINVLLDTSPLQTGSHIRGIGTYTRLLQRELEKRDDVRLFPVANKDELKNIQTNSGPLDPQQTVLHYPFFDLFFSTLPLFRKFKTVVTIHDVIPLKFPKFYRPGRRGRLRFYKQAFALQGVEEIITDSKASQADIIPHLKVKSERIHVVPLAAQPDIQEQPAEAQRKVLKQFSLPKKYVLYVGDINYNKNIPQLIKMIKFLPEDVDLVCVGKNFFPHDIPEWRWIETQIALSDVHSRVHFVTEVGADDFETLSAIYSAAEAYIQPSLYEGFGLPVLEAMQAKVPVIATDNSSLSEVAGGHALLVSTDGEEMADAVKEVLEWSKTHRQEVIDKAYKWSQTFSWKQTAADTVSVYKHMLGHQQ